MVVIQKTRNSSSSARPTSPDKAAHPSSSRHRRPQSTQAPSIQAIVSIGVLLLALLAHIFAPHFPPAIRRFFTQDQHWRVSSPGITLRNPVLFGEGPPTPPEPDQQ